MGIYDRAYYPDERQPGVDFGHEMSITTKLIVVNIVVYVADMLVGRGHWLMAHLAATPETLLRPWNVWQLLTYGFAHDPSDIRHIFWNMFALWMFGREVESVYGRKEYLRFYLLGIVVCGLVWTLRQVLLPTPGVLPTLVGASGALTGIIMLFVFLFPRRTILLMFIIPAPAWVIGVITILVNVFGVFGSSELSGGPTVAYDVHLTGAALAFCYFKFGWNLGRFVPQRWSWSPAWWRFRPSLKIHNPGSSSDNVDEAGDRILEKLYREGESSLTKSERKILEEYSRKMRQKHL